MGSGDNPLLFIMLANLPPKLKPIPKAECPDVMMWDKDNYQDWWKARKGKQGLLMVISSMSETNGGQHCKDFTHLYF